MCESFVRVSYHNLIFDELPADSDRVQSGGKMAIRLEVSVSVKHLK